MLLAKIPSIAGSYFGPGVKISWYKITGSSAFDLSQSIAAQGPYNKCLGGRAEPFTMPKVSYRSRVDAAAAVDTLETGRGHELGDSLARTARALAAQLGVNAGYTVGAPAPLVGAADLAGQAGVRCARSDGGRLDQAQ